MKLICKIVFTIIHGCNLMACSVISQTRSADLDKSIYELYLTREIKFCQAARIGTGIAKKIYVEKDYLENCRKQ